MRIDKRYVFDSCLRTLHGGYGLFLSSRQSVGVLKP